MSLLKNFGIKAITLFFIASSLFACKVREELPTVRRVRNMTASRVIKRVNANTLAYNTLSVKKVALSLKNDGKSQSIRASYKIRRDSIIQVMAHKATIPVGKLELDKDTFQIVYYIGKEVYEGSLASIAERLGIDLNFKAVQSILSGQPFDFRSDEKEKEFRDYHSSLEDGMYKISSLKARKLRKFNKKEDKVTRYLSRIEEESLIQQDIYIDPFRFIVRKIVMEELAFNRKLTLDFDAYELINGRWFPGEIKVEAIGKKRVELKIRLSKIHFDESQSFSFKVPSKYKHKELD